MAKDPAFLFYSKDWLEGTADLLPNEKGVYIDLLCYQHQRGFLPVDTQRLARLVGLSVTDFMEIWESLEPKFNRTDDRMVNRKLSEVMTERSNKAAKNKIIGTFAAVLRLSDLSKKEYLEAKKAFKIEDFTDTPTELLTERLTEWLHKRLKSIEDVNANEDANEDVNKEEKEKLKNEIIKNLSGNGRTKEEIETLATKTVEEDYAQFTRLTEWIEKHTPRVAQMKEPISLRQFVKLREEIKDKAKITELLKSMQNWQSLLKNNVSAYQTLLNWSRREN